MITEIFSRPIASLMPAFEHFAVDLDPGNAESGGTGGVDRPLPQSEFLVAQAVTCARLGAGDDALTDPSNDIGLAAGDPALGIRGWHPVDG